MSDEALLAAVAVVSGSRWAPLVPTIRAEAGLGVLGGGVRSDGFTDWGGSGDYGIALTWRIGPGGLFDPARRHLADSRRQTVRIERAKLQEEIIRQVVEARENFSSLSDQLQAARESLESATRVLELIRQRKDFGVGQVLEHIEAQRDLATVRLEYLRIVTDYNRSQFLLRRALGEQFD
jgi:outer membrane protein TolC